MKVIGIEGSIPREIERIAKSVRRWVLRESEDGKSGGMCGEASVYLIKKLAEIGIKAEYGSGVVKTDDDMFSHCWVEVKNKILDVTADQFNHQQKLYCFRTIIWMPSNKLRSIYVSCW